MSAAPKRYWLIEQPDLEDDDDHKVIHTTDLDVYPGCKILGEYALIEAAQPQGEDVFQDYQLGTWFKAKSIEEMSSFYFSRLDLIRLAAREHGYALGVHGSAKRDFDIIAMAWRENPSTKDELAEAIMMAACGIKQSSYAWEKKPHGRWAVSLPICWAEWEGCYGVKSLGHIDLSVMENENTPPTDDPQGEDVDISEIIETLILREWHLNSMSADATFGSVAKATAKEVTSYVRGLIAKNASPTDEQRAKALELVERKILECGYITSNKASKAHHIRWANHELEEWEIIRAALQRPAVAQWRPTHKHVKRGTSYEVLGEAYLQSNDQIGEGETLFVYRGDDGKLWCRPKDEFNDGRFETLPKPLEDVK